MPNIPPLRTPILDSNQNMTRDWIKWFQEVQSTVSIAATFQMAPGEIPAGIIDGSNKVYTLSKTPLYGIPLSKNGLMLLPNVHYSLSGPTITFAVAPSPGNGSDIHADNIYVGPYAY